MARRVSVSKIEDGLFLGNRASAMDLATLNKNKISHVLTIEQYSLPDTITNIPEITFLHICAADNVREDLLSRFHLIFDFISEGQKQGNVLVHCYGGVSRSSTAVMAYLMKKYDFTYFLAFIEVKRKRKCVLPNIGFVNQLRMYESLNCDVDILDTTYKYYRLMVASNAIKSGTFVKENFNDLIRSQIKDDLTSGIKCKACKVSLFSEEDLTYHKPGINPSWRETNITQFVKEGSCQEGIFTLPFQWMKDILGSTQGKIACWQCGVTLGTFNWIKGSDCPCQAKIVPAFHISPTKVDIL